MNIIEMKITDIKPYENNPRRNDTAVRYVANSIKEFGFKVPIVIDKDNIIVCGHTRWKAAKRLGLPTVPCIMADDLSEAQIKAFRLADNKTAEIADWDMSALDLELSGLDMFNMGDFGFDVSLEDDRKDDSNGEEDSDKYTKKVEVPQYEPTGENVSLQECFNDNKTEDLISEIKNSDKISNEEKDFLEKAAQRHTVFNYRKIAEYYANKANKDMQDFMEKSALVIIDFDDAMKNGFVVMDKRIQDIVEEASKNA